MDDRLVEIDDKDEPVLGEELDAGFQCDLVCLLRNRANERGADEA